MGFYSLVCAILLVCLVLPPGCMSEGIIERRFDIAPECPLTEVNHVHTDARVLLDKAVHKRHGVLTLLRKARFRGQGGRTSSLTAVSRIYAFDSPDDYAARWAETGEDGLHDDDLQNLDELRGHLDSVRLFLNGDFPPISPEMKLSRSVAFLGCCKYFSTFHLRLLL